MQNLNQSILLNLVVGLPPLAEQRRLVARVNELMALCDRLGVQLSKPTPVSARPFPAGLRQRVSCPKIRKVFPVDLLFHN
jgi:restriction endonuclease S subunit